MRFSAAPGRPCGYCRGRRSTIRRFGIYHRLSRLGWPRSYGGKFALVALLGGQLPLLALLGWQAWARVPLLDPAGAAGVAPMFGADLLVVLIADALAVALTLAALQQLTSPVEEAGAALERYLVQDGITPPDPLAEPPRPPELPSLEQLPRDYADEAGLLLRNVQAAVDALDAKNRQLAHFATHDAATGLYNRAVAEELLAKHLALASRQGQPLSVALVDVDDFNELDASLGRSHADAALAAVAHEVQQQLRESDWAARWGDGQILLTMFTGAEGALVALERVRASVMALPQEPMLTVSGGLAEATCADPGRLIAHADAALTHARGRGRNHLQQHADLRPA